MNCHIIYRSDKTGLAWWPVGPKDTFSFEYNAQYKIFGQLYVADTTVFRNAWEDAMCQHTWNRINKDPN